MAELFQPVSPVHAVLFRRHFRSRIRTVSDLGPTTIPGRFSSRRWSATGDSPPFIQLDKGNQNEAERIQDAGQGGFDVTTRWTASASRFSHQSGRSSFRTVRERHRMPLGVPGGSGGDLKRRAARIEWLDQCCGREAADRGVSGSRNHHQWLSGMPAGTSFAGIHR